MKNISQIVKSTQKMLDDYSPQILTAFAVVGTGLTGYLAAKGGMKAAEDIREFESKDNGLWVKSSIQEKVLLTWKTFAPAVVVGTGTAACTIMATKIGLNRTAAVGAALVVSERAYDQYKDKVVEQLGQNKHVKVRDAVATENVQNIPAGQMIVVGDGELLCYDNWSGRTFKSTREKLERAVNELNHEMLLNDYCSLSDFYDKVGLAHTTESDDIGWRNDHLLELIYTSVLVDDKPVLAFTFDGAPNSRFDRSHP